MEEISLIELWDGIRKRLVWIILAALLGGVAAFALSRFVVAPKYEASTTMIVGRPNDMKTGGTSQIEYNDLLVNQRLVPTYSEIIRSRTITNDVLSNLALDMTSEELSERITVQTLRDSEIISVRVTDTIPERAMDIANETSEIFVDSVKDIMNIDNVQILDAAEMPEKPVSPRILFNTLVGIILGLMIGLMMAVVREVMDDTLKTTEDITDGFEMAVLGVIPTFRKGE